MESLEQILNRHNCPIRVSEEKISFTEIESIISFALPQDYKVFLEKYLEFEGLIGKEYIHLWDFKHLTEYNEDYLIFENLPKTIGIGDNGSGEFIAIQQIDDNSLRIILSPFVDLDSQYHIEIGNSFSNFLERISNGEEWF